MRTVHLQQSIVHSAVLSSSFWKHQNSLLVTKLFLKLRSELAVHLIFLLHSRALPVVDSCVDRSTSRAFVFPNSESELFWEKRCFCKNVSWLLQRSHNLLRFYYDSEAILLIVKHGLVPHLYELMEQRVIHRNQWY